MSGGRLRTARVLVPALMMAGFLAAVAPGAAAGAGCHLPPTAGTGTSVDIKESCFSQTVLFVTPGDTVTWTNLDPYAHVVAGFGGSWGTFDNMATGSSVSARFDSAGVYPYACYLHPGMNGAVVVTDEPGALAASLGASGGSGPSSMVGAPNPTAAQGAEIDRPAPDDGRAAAASDAGWRLAAVISMGLLVLAVISVALLITERRRSSTVRIPA